MDPRPRLMIPASVLAFSSVAWLGLITSNCFLQAACGSTTSTARSMYIIFMFLIVIIFLLKVFKARYSILPGKILYLEMSYGQYLFPRRNYCQLLNLFQDQNQCSS